MSSRSRLRDVLTPRPRMLFVGINPSLRSEEVGHHFAGPGNPFWRLLYAAGMKFLLLSAILYGPGTVLYAWAKREQNKQLFTAVEWVIFAVTLIGAAVGIHGLATGYITI